MNYLVTNSNNTVSFPLHLKKGFPAWATMLMATVATGFVGFTTAQSAQAITTSAIGNGFTIDDLATQSSPVSFSDTFAIEDVTVTLNSLSHTWASDITASLTHVDTNTSVELFSDVLGSTELSGTYAFNDSFSPNITLAPGSPVSSGNYSLESASLSAFDGELPNGTWQLTIADNVSGDAGSLGSWQLDLSDTNSAAVPVPFEFSPTLGLILVGAGFGLKRGRNYWQAKSKQITLS